MGAEEGCAPSRTKRGSYRISTLLKMILIYYHNDDLSILPTTAINVSLLVTLFLDTFLTNIIYIKSHIIKDTNAPHHFSQQKRMDMALWKESAAKC